MCVVTEGEAVEAVMLVRDEKHVAWYGGALGARGPPGLGMSAWME